MSELKYKMEFSLGDPSCDGHRYSETFYIRSNYSSKDIEKIYEEACKMLEFDYVKEAANEYEYQNLDKKYVTKLIEVGIINKNDDLIVKEKDDHFIYGETGDISFDEKEDYIKLFFNIIKWKKPDFEWEFAPFVNDILRPLEGAAYGLF